jgi:hypothetical protein
MSSFPSTNPSIGRFQQFQKQFSTTSANMSQTNNNFLLSEVFNVKGKVRLRFLDPTFRRQDQHANHCRLLLSLVEEVALA